MKTVSVLIPTFNEEENVRPLTEAIIKEFEQELPEYQYELVFIDNDSTDRTKEIIRELCNENQNIKAIFNAKNFGPFNSPYHGILQTTGDCTILLCADFQDPIDMIHKFVREWENGYKIVIGRKTTSQENRFMYFVRTCYYKAIKKFSDVEQIEHFTGFGLYDKSFVKVLRDLKDPTPFLRGIVAELGFKRKEIAYEQLRRRAGKTGNNFMRLYDAAMLSFTSYTKIGLRLATFIGFGISAFSFLVALIYLVLKLIYWDRFVAGTAPILLGMFFLGAVQLIFMGLMGEYILSINQRTMNHPLVIEEERINFKEEDKES
ncbi:MAG: glycosyltransferase family 2 protein [Lachnospiraceae bacterium]|jgi:glycosyltransferase involved in cell wall biosynthesis|nr:glycosyltransferase family 2 protein [Lachnospiraceae bacterium]